MPVEPQRNHVGQRIGTLMPCAAYANRQVSLDTRQPISYLSAVEIESVNHKELRRFIETGNAKGVPGDADRIRNMVAYLIRIAEEEELFVPPSFGAHKLVGNRSGTWSLTVTRNWRMTFKVNAEGAIIDLDLEDYHGR